MTAQENDYTSQCASINTAKSLSKVWGNVTIAYGCACARKVAIRLQLHKAWFAARGIALQAHV